MKDLLERAKAFCYEREDEHGSMGSVWSIMADFAARELSREWVPVSEGLPPRDELIWVTRRFDGLVQSYRLYPTTTNEEIEAFILAWMPKTKPEPYKELT